jgi:hypothetical protein
MTRTHGTQATPVALALSLALGVCACDVGSPASPVFDNGMSGLTTDAGPGDGGNYYVCPTDIDASFTSLLTQMFATGSCGSNTPLSCHSATGAAPSGTGNLLDFSASAAAVYSELVGADGGGVYATNLSGSAHILRVAPGDAGASMLYIKLTLTAAADPMYGAGMPQGFPGSVCPAAVDAVRAWIDQGAQNN